MVLGGFGWFRVLVTTVEFYATLTATANQLPRNNKIIWLKGAKSVAHFSNNCPAYSSLKTATRCQELSLRFGNM